MAKIPIPIIHEFSPSELESNLSKILGSYSFGFTLAVKKLIIIKLYYSAKTFILTLPNSL